MADSLQALPRRLTVFGAHAPFGGNPFASWPATNSGFTLDPVEFERILFGKDTS